MGMSQQAWSDRGLALDEPTLCLAHLSPTEPQPANAWMGEK
jgi:hypothetical protein